MEFHDYHSYQSEFLLPGAHVMLYALNGSSLVAMVTGASPIHAGQYNVELGDIVRTTETA